MTLALVKNHETAMLERLVPLVKAFDSVESEIGGFATVLDLARQVKLTGARIFFIGNGGSAAIASHMSADWSKNAGFAAMTFNDPASLTCIANDLGYASVFSQPLALHGRKGDLLFAISSAGRSLSIVNAINVAQLRNLDVVTLSGFDRDNTIRGMGLVNFYVPSTKYGTVELAHHAILHALLDELLHP